MTLASGSLVFIDCNSGFRAEPPPFGTVLSASEATGQYDVRSARVVFERLGVVDFSTAEAMTRLVEITADPGESAILGTSVEISGFRGIIARSFLRQPGNVRTVLIASERGQAPETGFTARHSGYLVAPY